MVLVRDQYGKPLVLPTAARWSRDRGRPVAADGVFNR
jgi:hypothetical protein